MLYAYWNEKLNIVNWISIWFHVCEYMSCLNHLGKFRCCSFFFCFKIELVWIWIYATDTAICWHIYDIVFNCELFLLNLCVLCHLFHFRWWSFFFSLGSVVILVLFVMVVMPYVVCVCVFIACIVVVSATRWTFIAVVVVVFFFSPFLTYLCLVFFYFIPLVIECANKLASNVYTYFF